MTWPEAFNSDETINVIIEAPSKGRNKFSFDQETGLFKLKKVLPSGLAFPCDMGFIPKTVGEDGDPLDALILMEEFTYPGCWIECRLLGAMIAKQVEKKKPIRNDRFICVPAKMKEYDHLKYITDLNKNKLNSISNFFMSYNSFYNIRFKASKMVNAAQAEKLIRKGLV